MPRHEVAMRYTWLLVLVVLTLVTVPVTGFIGPGDTINISVNRTGDNFVWWWWGNSSMDSGPNVTKTIFVDQELKVSNGSLNYYILTDINPDEEHIIEIRGYNQTLNSLNYTIIESSKTYEQDIWMLLYIGCGIVVIGWFTAPILILLSSGVFLLGFGMAYDMTTQSYILLTYALAFVFSMFTFAIRWGGK